ncbi:uncharacterized protein mpc2a isoform X1 [Ictalurus furcatus]|uniref:uncharacterized protein mpc2a isoform X1 n=1 Tax=Ictalurus furcatus TaxID=66913 RepID=UPI002350C1AC|nr:uncharacterized protein mpc2a isoform X1 [Ictalurus furcatus]
MALRWVESYLSDRSVKPDDPTVSARISACLSDINCMREHHLELNLAKSELLVIPACPSINHNLMVQLSSTTLKPTRTARNLGMTFDDSLTITDHISTTARSCRFILYNIKKIRPYLTKQAKQQLVQATNLVISKLDYCNALLLGLSASSIKHLQTIQNAAAHLVFNQPKRTKCHTPLHLPLLASCSRLHEIQSLDAHVQDLVWNITPTSTLS